MCFFDIASLSLLSACENEHAMSAIHKIALLCPFKMNHFNLFVNQFELNWLKMVILRSVKPVHAM